MDDATVERLLRGRGGSRQQLEFEELADDPIVVEKSPLADALLFLLSWGLLSYPMVNWLAKCAIEGDPNHPDLHVLANLGASGQYPGNMRRDLFSKLDIHNFLPEPLPVDVVAVNTVSQEIEVPQYVLSLPEVLESLWTHRRDHFHNMFGDAPRQFWDQIPEDDPKLVGMADLMKHDGWQDITYPFVVHGDGGTYSKKTESSVFVVSAKSMLAERFAGNIIPGIVLPKHVRKRGGDHDTADELWRAYIHGLNAAYDGIHPAKNHLGRDWPIGSRQAKLAGTALCGGRVRVVVFTLTGDLEYFALELRYPHFNSVRPCWLCNVCRNDLDPCRLTDLSLNAEWKRNLVTAAFDLFVPLTDHPIAQLRNFSRSLSPGDLMHTGPGGVLAWFLGAVLWELVYDGPWGGPVLVRLQALWEQIVFAYRALESSSRLSMLSLSMFYNGPGRWTCFRGKCADALELLYVLREVCTEFNTRSERDLHRLACFESLCFIFDSCKGHRWTIPRPIAEEMLQQCDVFLLHYNWLTRFSVDLGRLNYNIVFKCHSLWHIVHHARYLNPRVTWCYAFEDFVGTVIQSAKGCMHGSPLLIVGAKVLQNFLLDLHLRTRL